MFDSSARALASATCLLVGCGDGAPSGTAPAAAPASAVASARAIASDASADAGPAPSRVMVAGAWTEGIEGVTAIASTRAAVYAMRRDGSVVRWGASPQDEPRTEPVTGARSLHAAAKQVCVVTVEDRVACRSDPWVASGAGPTVWRDDGWVPFPALGDVITMGGAEARWIKVTGETRKDAVWYVVRRDGSVAAWEWSPELAAADRPPPRVVPGLAAATAIAVGEDHACAVLAGGVARCWHHLLVVSPSADAAPVPAAIEPPLAVDGVVDASGPCLTRGDQPLLCLEMDTDWARARSTGRRALLEPRDGEVVLVRRAPADCEIRRGERVRCAWRTLPLLDQVTAVDVGSGHRHWCVLDSGGAVRCTLG